MALLEVASLAVRYPDAAEAAVTELSFSLEPGTSLGLVGESGSGKTQTAMAIMGLLPANAIVSGGIRFDGEELLGAKLATLRRFRARKVGMVFQDPAAALNPYVRVGKQLARILKEHRLCSRAEARGKTLAMLSRVGLPDPERQYDAYPHQLSGGMRQRVMIGAALIGEPDLLIADEPTTALDVTVQAQILALLDELRAELNTALLLITHDLGVIAGHCEQTLVIDRGRLIEDGPTAEVFTAPLHERTRALLEATPRLDAQPMSKPLDASLEPLLEVRDISVSFRERRLGRRARLQAVHPLSLSIRPGETMAIVGESGAGKTTLARGIAGLRAADGGTLRFDGKPLAPLTEQRANETRRRLQMVFQDPLASLNPAMTVHEILAEPMRLHEPAVDRDHCKKRVLEMLERVGLDQSLQSRYPHELSGGQAQRVAIARALIPGPKVLICDEAAAALDGTVKDGILKLLLAEQQHTGLSLIFITHDLAVVRRISHRVLVMYMGRVFELADNESLFARPRHPYSRALIDSVPAPDPRAPRGVATVFGEASSILEPPPGCPFHPRCSHAVAACSKTVPELTAIGHLQVACHRAAELDLRGIPPR